MNQFSWWIALRPRILIDPFEPNPLYRCITGLATMKISAPNSGYQNVFLTDEFIFSTPKWSLCNSFITDFRKKMALPFDHHGIVFYSSLLHTEPFTRHNELTILIVLLLDWRIIALYEFSQSYPWDRSSRWVGSHIVSSILTVGTTTGCRSVKSLFACLMPRSHSNYMFGHNFSNLKETEASGDQWRLRTS